MFKKGAPKFKVGRMPKLSWFVILKPIDGYDGKIGVCMHCQVVPNFNMIDHMFWS